MTKKGSVEASGTESSSEADTESQAGGDSGSKEGEDSGGEGEGSGSKGEGSGGEGELGDGDSQQGDSTGKVVEVSCHKAEESGGKSGSSSSESEVEAKKAHPSRKTVETDSNTTLPELDSKDSEKEWKTNCHSIAHCMDAYFDAWRNKKISQGLKQWDEWDKMTCDQAEPD